MKKAVLLMAALVSFLAFGSMSQAAANAEENQGSMPQIVGTWLMRVEFAPYPPFQVLQQFVPGGKTTLLLSFGVPPCALTTPPTCMTPDYWSGDTRVGCMGDWTPRGRRQFDVTMYCLPHQGDGYVPDRLRLKMTLNRDGQVVTAKGFTYEWFNPDGTLLFGGQGDLTGKRLAHVPLP